MPRLLRERDYLAVREDHLLRQAAHRTRRVIAQNLDWIAPAILDAGAEDDCVLARFDALYFRPNLDDLDYARIADDDLGLVPLHADVDRPSIERVAHVAFPGAV